jgi:hypothetical protein
MKKFSKIILRVFDLIFFPAEVFAKKESQFKKTSKET